jgi:proteasome regulatory subunit
MAGEAANVKVSKDGKSSEYEYTVNTSALEEENHLLRQTVQQLRLELERFRTPPLMVCEVSDVYDDGIIIKIPNGNKFFTAKQANMKIMAGDTVLADQKNLVIIRKINDSKQFNVERFVIMERPQVGWKDIGGLQEQIAEIKEVVELPLKKPELFKKIGITPPKGILLYGPPGTGKTLLAKAVANETGSNFIEIVGSELVQKFIGEGAKMINEIFDMARTKAPCIIFIDEIDSLAAKRIDMGTSGEREVQRTFMQLLAELDGFKPLGNIKIIAATNRKDILDPAILRPGRFDRLIFVPPADHEGRRAIFKIHTRNMKLVGVKEDKLLDMMEDFSGAEIHAVCTEAGYFALREERTTVKQTDFEKAIEKVKRYEEIEGTDYLKMYG